MKENVFAEDRILDAFEELLLKKSFNKIRVKEIFELAGVSKPTFYNHFDDKYDLARKLYDRDMEMIYKRYHEESRDIVSFYYEVFHMLESRKKIYHTLFKMPYEQNSVYQYSIDKAIEFFEAHLNKKSYTEEMQLRLRIFIYGTINYAWTMIEGSCPFDRDYIGKILAVMPDFLKQIFQII